MTRALPDQGEILRCLRTQSRGLHLSEIATRLRVPAARRKRLGASLDTLVSEGVIVRLPGGRFRAASGAVERPAWEGWLSVHPRGFGFVNAQGQEDVYVSPDALAGAMHGDRVVVQVMGRTTRGVEGQIEAIVERRPARIAGVLRRRRKSCWLEPDDTRIRGPIVVKGALGEARDGAAAVVAITRFPELVEETPEAELVEVLGEPGEARVEVQKILTRDGIEEDRDPEAEREARRRAEELSPVSLEGRKDLRDVPLLTIDPADARDHDDAVHVERRQQGYRAYVAIADVAEYVQDGGALDADALRRCFTTYLPDRAVPMLAPLLASNHCSLLPGCDRYSLCLIVDLDLRGHVRRTRLVEAVVHVAAKLSYEDAAAVLGFTEGAATAEALQHKRALRALNDLAGRLRRGRMARGALDLDLPEPKVELDPDTGRPTAVVRRAKDPGVGRAYQLVEEMMLLANERVARWLSGRRSPAVYRVHAPPDEERLEQLGQVARLLGVPFDAESLAKPTGVNQWLQSIQKHPLRSVLEGFLLRSLKQAQYDTTNVGHFGLASEAYVHFTSPIRRYPDLIVHRLCKALLRGGKPEQRPEALEQLQQKAARSSEVERTVLQASREVVDVYRCLLMQQHIGEVFEGRVTGLSGSGVYVQLFEPFVDVFVRFESLGGDRYEASEDGLRAMGQRTGDRVALGDAMVVEVEDVGLLRRTIYGRRIASEATAVGEPLELSRKRPRGRRASERQKGRPRSGRDGSSGAGQGSTGGQGGGASGGSGRGQRGSRRQRKSRR